MKPAPPSSAQRNQARLDPLSIVIDLDPARKAAEAVVARLEGLRARHDLAAFEYCRNIRVAPTELPFSHPMITLNTFVRSDEALLATYLHEQMHWYATWFSHTHCGQWRNLIQALAERYPDAPVGGAQGARDAFSTILHLVINWLEVEALSQFFERSDVIERALAAPFYRWIYATVIADWEPLEHLNREAGLVPIRSAAAMSEEDLRLAALMDEAPV